MAMCNSELIALYVSINNVYGNDLETLVSIFQEIPLHTYQGWLKRGYQVRQGEKAKHHISIWKIATKTEKTTGQRKQVAFLKNSAFFEHGQVDKVIS